MERSCERGNESTSSIKAGKLLDQFCDYLLPMEGCSIGLSTCWLLIRIAGLSYTRGTVGGLNICILCNWCYVNL
jgi:hypothetical protein